MEYKISKEELANDWLYSTLIALNTCMAKHGLPLYIVGARARDVAMKLMKGEEPKRRTEDLDVAVAIENWQMFDDICQTLQENHFKRYGDTQKFFYKGENDDIDFEVDIVPFGGVAVDEKIGWPPEENPVMSVKCFEDVMKEAVSVSVDNVVKVKMAPLCGQFLIKLDTWNDRHAATDKDAEDMLFILKNYLDIQLIYQDDKTPPDVVNFEDERTDTIIWGAQWLAYDISKLLTTEHLQFYTELISKEIEQEEKSELIYHFMKYYGNKEVDDISTYYEPCRSIWGEFKQIFSNELKERTKDEN
jgi:predicted nucleotidyltransferase